MAFTRVVSANRSERLRRLLFSVSHARHPRPAVFRIPSSERLSVHVAMPAVGTWDGRNLKIIR